MIVVAAGNRRKITQLPGRDEKKLLFLVVGGLCCGSVSGSGGGLVLGDHP